MAFDQSVLELELEDALDDELVAAGTSVLLGILAEVDPHAVKTKASMRITENITYKRFDFIFSPFGFAIRDILQIKDKDVLNDRLCFGYIQIKNGLMEDHCESFIVSLMSLPNLNLLFEWT